MLEFVMREVKISVKSLPMTKSISDEDASPS